MAKIKKDELEIRVTKLEGQSLNHQLYIELMVAHLSGQQGRDTALIRVRKLLGIQN